VGSAQQGGHGDGEPRIWLDVPYSEKDEAHSSGAMWDPSAARWYAPEAEMASLERWQALPDLPALLLGEDRTFGSGLFVDLVPKKCWFKNARYCVSERDWERLRRMVLGRAGHRCEVCGQAKSRRVERWLEVHERWEFDLRGSRQILRRLVCLCTPCHTATHLGLAEQRGKDGEARTHLMTVTGMSEEEAQAHIMSAIFLWEQRNRQTWSLDLSMLTTAGIEVRPPQKKPGARRAAPPGGGSSAGRKKYRVPHVGGSGGHRRNARPR